MRHEHIKEWIKEAALSAANVDNLPSHASLEQITAAHKDWQRTAGQLKQTFAAHAERSLVWAIQEAEALARYAALKTKHNNGTQRYYQPDHTAREGELVAGRPIQSSLFDAARGFVLRAYSDILTGKIEPRRDEWRRLLSTTYYFAARENKTANNSATMDAWVGILDMAPMHIAMEAVARTHQFEVRHPGRSKSSSHEGFKYAWARHVKHKRKQLGLT